MTEEEWHMCPEPRMMLRFLRKLIGSAEWLDWRNRQQHEYIPRRWRLIAAACCRRLPRLNLQDRSIIEMVERWADLQRTQIDWASEFEQYSLLSSKCRHYSTQIISSGIFLASVVGWVRRTISLRGSVRKQKRSEILLNSLIILEKLSQCDLIRDIFGNPFRPISLEPSWLTSSVVALASAIYEQRAFDRMPILADALEEAGCDNAEILNHCRLPGEHVRGCWVVDLLLGKE